VLLLGSPLSHPSRAKFLAIFTRLLADVTERVHVVSADEPADEDNVVWTPLNSSDGDWLVTRLWRFCLMQFRLSRQVVRHRSETDIVVVRSPPFVLPVACAKLLDLPTAAFMAQRQSDPVTRGLSVTTFYLTDTILVESFDVVDQWPITPAAHHIERTPMYVDCETYSKSRPVDDREYELGYLGNLSERKGVDQLLDAVKVIEDRGLDVDLRVGGDGPLTGSVAETAASSARVDYPGFVPEEDLQTFYNSVKLLVLPSETEGVPKVVLESMACGTPVLATDAGGIGTAIDDERNGYLIRSRDPETIAAGVTRVLESEPLESVSEAAACDVRDRFDRGTVTRQYSEVFSRLAGGVCADA
jgi:glycosyltransferase involved in cell wall biosynthesis